VEEIRAALDRQVPIALILCEEVDEAALRSPGVHELLARARSSGIAIRYESAREMRRMSGGSEAAELLALEGPGPPADLDALMREDGIVFVLTGLRYPGNVGYIVRCAEVAGAAGVVLCADWEGDQRAEAARVGMHAERFLGVLEAEPARALAAARRAGRRILALETSGDRAPWQVDLAEPVVVLVGGETTGIPAGILAQADEVVGIPMHGFIPSFNVQGAVGIVLGEWLRQTAPS
jgi:tRNA G18 (ribose-2'-O)-methylase SpoU